MDLTYEFASLQAMAVHFARRAAQARSSAERHKGSARAALIAEAVAYEDAANVARNSVLTPAPRSLATPDEIEEARGQYAISGEDVVIYPDAVASRGDGGLWVEAWVWLARPDKPADQPA